MELLVLIILFGIFAFCRERRQRSPDQVLPPEPYRIKFSDAYSAVVHVLENGPEPPHGWKIIKHSREHGLIQAVFELIQALARKDGTVHNVKTKVTCRITLTAQEDGATDLSMHYDVTCPRPACREPLGVTIAMLTDLVNETLSELEVKKHG